MKIEEAIVYVMVKRNGGMTTDQIADAINRHRLHLRQASRCMQQSAVSLKCSQKKLAESC